VDNHTPGEGFEPLLRFLAKPKKVSAVLLAWTTLHLWLWSKGGHSEATHLRFWPFDPMSSDAWLIYDRSEFFIYAVLPWAAYLIYALWTDKKWDSPA